MIIIQEKRWLGLILVISSTAFSGIAGSVADLMFNTYNVSSLWVVGVRLLVSGFPLLLIYRLMNQHSIFSIWHDSIYRKQLLSFSFLGMLPNQLFYFLAIKFGNAATATILQFTGPIFIIIYVALRQKRLPSIVDTISVIIAMIGTFLLATKGSLDSLSMSFLGLLFGLGAGISLASYTLVPAKLLNKYDSILVCGWGMLIGSVPMLPIIVMVKQPHFDLNFSLELLFIIIFGTMLTYLFYVASLKYLAPAVTGVLSSFEPLTATFISVAFLGVKLSFIELMGVALILLTAFIQVIPQKDKVE